MTNSVWVQLHLIPLIVHLFLTQKTVFIDTSIVLLFTLRTYALEIDIEGIKAHLYVFIFTFCLYNNTIRWTK